VDDELSDEQLALKQTIREFALAEIAPYAAEWDRTETFPLDVIKKLGALGVMGLQFPEEYGGLGAGTLSQALVIEELARVDSSVAITVAANVSLGGGPLYLFGTHEQKLRWLVPLARGECLGAFGLTEAAGGSDIYAMETTARREGDGWAITGTKAFITNAGTPLTRFVAVAAVTGRRGSRKEISNFIVPTDAPGFSVGRAYRKMGWHASDTRELVFEDCRIPADCQLGELGRGAAQFLAVLDGGRIGIAALSVGLAQGCLDLALDYARRRVAFGRPIASYQAIQTKLADLATEIQAARLLYYHAARVRDAGRPYTKEAAMAKLFASEVAVRAADAALQIYGGIGYLEETPVPRFYRDAKILTIGEGTSEIQRLVIARHLLGE
jgi:butyryl-CoA dehydrogenase